MFTRRPAGDILLALSLHAARCVALLVACALPFSATPAQALPLGILTNTLTNGTAGVPYSGAIEVSGGTAPYNWSLNSGGLPGGVALDGATGALSGTATLAGTSNFIVQVTDALGDTATRAFPITIVHAAASALSFSAGPSNVTVGVVMSPAVQVKVSDAFGNGVAGESVSLALTGSGTLTGGGAVVTDAGGIATFSSLSIDRAGSAQLNATAGALGPVASASFSVSCPAITVSPATLATGAATVAYSATFTASGGTASHTFAVIAGVLPAGLSLSGAGELTGTPTNGGSFGFTVSATDANLCTGSRAYTLVICAPLTLLPASLPAAQPGVLYSQALSATAGTAPYTFALTAGALPAGLTLSSAGLLSGTPTVTGSASFTVTATDASGCTGSLAYTLTVPGVPAAVSNLAAVRATSGNDADGTSRIQITFTPSAFATSAEVYRAPFGGYPRYDDAGGVVPPTPSYPPGAPWVLTPVTASGQADEPATRDAWSYVVFLKNTFAQVSGVSNKTVGGTNYALGDVSNGLAPGAGDNLVNDADVSLLGAYYGISGSAITTANVHYLDVGPTTDLAVTSRPFTDNRIDFEDLIVFATNYGAVSAPQWVASADGALHSAKGLERFSVGAPALVEAGAVFAAVVRMEAAGRVQGLSAELGWDPSVAEVLSVASAGWVERQQGIVLTPRPGVIDAALLGARSSGLVGAGELATVTFRARRVGDPAVRLVRVLARDAANRPLGEGAVTFGRDPAIPSRTLLLAPSPNPSRGDAGVSFALAQGGDIDLSIYSVDGRKVRVIARGVFAAGTYRFSWNGTDEQHRAVAPGVYFAQLVAGGKRFSRAVVHLQ